jgi:GTPase SAR1 family protein
VSVFAGFAIICVEAFGTLYKRLHAVNFGVYGAAMVGKTTLHRQLRTRGEVPDIKRRTVGLQGASRKVVKIDGKMNTIRAADVGGQSQYWNLWRKDMRKRKPQYIIFVIDHRHLENRANLQNQLAWQYIVDLICDTHWRDGRRLKKKKEKDYPRAIGIWANKYDLWGDQYEFDDISKHPIFEPFAYGMQKLNDQGIPCFKYIVSAKSDPEMVYRGVITMINYY